MPIVYVETRFEKTVNLSKDDDFVFGEWTGKELEKGRLELKKPNKGLWFEIQNPDDPVETFPIPINENDIYEGGIEITRNDRTFTFGVNLRAKVNVHKSTKEKIDQGLLPDLTGLSINGQQFPVRDKIALKIQSKKI